MIKSIVRSFTISATLLLSGCTGGDVFGVVASLFLVFVVFVFIEYFRQSSQRVENRRAMQSIALSQINKSTSGDLVARNELQVSDILVDITGSSGIAIDTANMQVGIVRGVGKLASVTMIPYRDVLSSEIIEDGESITKTNRGSQIGGALIGGLALGGAGAIIGGLSGSSKSVDKVFQIALVLTINDVKDPMHYVTIPGEYHGVEKSHPKYKDAMGKAKEWHGKMQVVIRQADEEDRRQEKEDAEKTVAVNSQGSLADELAKLGELRDKGILSEEEFANQKAKLLAE